MALAYIPAPFPCPLPECDVFPFHTQDDLDLHLADHLADSTGTPATVITPKLVPLPASTVIETRGRFETVANGFGGQTTRTLDRPKVDDLPTVSQTDFLRKLLAEREGISAAEAVRERINEQRETGEWSRRIVSAAITQLLEIPVPRPTAKPKAAPMPDVPAGMYAFHTDEGHIAFCKIDRPEDGKWAGYVFCKLLLGAPKSWRTERLAMPTQRAIMAKIAAYGIAESLKLFGDTHKVCGMCDSPLSNERSLKAGYGETCAGNHGLPY